MKIRFLDSSEKEVSILRMADLYGADLRGADLRMADLRGADLRMADLRGADLREADLREADLRGADLRGADLREASLRGADLRGATLLNIEVDYTTSGYFNTIPEGVVVAWKKIGERIIKLEIPEDAKRSSATTRKCRVSKAKVLSISDGIREIKHLAYGHCTIYRVGEMVYPDSFDEDRWNECSNGIHCFMTKEEAKNWI